MKRVTNSYRIPGLIMLATVFLMTILCFSGAYAAIVAQGPAGMGVYWELSDKGVVTVYGSGKMVGTPAWDHADEVKKVIIKDGVTNVGYLNGHKNLESVVMADSVKEIENLTFYDCPSLKSVTFSKRTERIGNSAFSRCTSLTKLTIPESVNTIGEGAFCDSSSLKEITLPSGVKSIEYGTFAGCSSLKKINIPSEVTKIGEMAFNYCDALESIRIPKSVKTIEKFAIGTCAKLKDVYYTGTEKDRKQINIAECNNSLLEATWHYQNEKNIQDAFIERIKDQDYTGKPLKPAIVVKHNGDRLTEGTDYTVAYSNNTEVGQAEVKITGLGQYTGEKKIYFQINPAAVKLISVTGETKQLTVKWKANKTVHGYEIQYDENSNFPSERSVTIKKASTTKTTIKKLNSNLTYVVRIRTFRKVGKKVYYSAWSKPMSAKVK